jgi:hypothetical protein
MTYGLHVLMAGSQLGSPVKVSCLSREMGGEVGSYWNPFVDHSATPLAGMVLNLCLTSGTLGLGTTGKGEDRRLFTATRGSYLTNIRCSESSVCGSFFGDPSRWVTYRRPGTSFVPGSPVRIVDATTSDRGPRFLSHALHT